MNTRGKTVLGFVLWAYVCGTAYGASMSEELASRGHPNTKMCRLDPSSAGLGQLLVVQFDRRESGDANFREAVEILKLIADPLLQASVHYVGFEATKKWSTCRKRGPKYVFWRDYDENWRHVRPSPVKYLSRLRDELPTELEGTPAEAYVLWSLGLVQQRLRRLPVSLENFERAYEILKHTDNPDSIVAYLIIPLFHHYVGKDGDEEKAQSLLEHYALVAKETAADDLLLPIVKIAPDYPKGAYSRGIEGWVLLEFTVDAKGRVRNPVVVEESPAGVFGDAAMKATKMFRYVPKVVDGQLVPTNGVRNKINFELAD